MPPPIAQIVRETAGSGGGGGAPSGAAGGALAGTYPDPTLAWPIDNTGAAAGTDALTLDVTGDTQLRFVVNHDGSLEWGSGAAVADTVFGRTAVRTLTFDSPGSNNCIFRIATDTANSRYLTITGSAFTTTTTPIVFTPGNGQTTQFVSSAAAAIPVIVSGAASQSGNLTEWRNSAGTILARIASDGSFTNSVATGPAGTFVFAHGVGGSTVLLGSNPVGVWSTADQAGVFPLICKGHASQSVNLTDWRNSANVTLLGVSPSGSLDGAGGVTCKLTVTDLITLQKLSNGRGFQLALSSSGSADMNNALSGDKLRFHSNATGPGSLVLRTSTQIGNEQATTDIALIVKGVASQSADLQQWQNSAAAVQASVGITGIIESGPLRAKSSNVVAATGATETLDLSLYDWHDITMDESCTFTFSNPAASGKSTSFILFLRGAFTPTWPASVDWPDGAQPTYTTPSMYSFNTIDGGTTYFGAQIGKAFG